MADAIENTVALDGQTTTTTDNAILRYDSGNTKFEGVTISASQIVGRSATGDTRGMSAATARQTIGLGTAAATNDKLLAFSSSSNQFVETAYTNADVANVTGVITTEGDLMVGDGSGDESRLAIGSNNRVLGSNGTTASWRQVDTDDIANDAITTAKILAGNVTTSEIASNTIAQGDIANSAIGQGELKTTTDTQTLSLTSGSGSATKNRNTAAGSYGMGFRSRYDVNGDDSSDDMGVLVGFSAGPTDWDITRSSGTDNGMGSYVTLHTNNNSTNNSNTTYFEIRYVQASPPYDLGDGECGLFVTADIDANGNVVGISLAPDPIWANNGPTDIRADWTDPETGKEYKAVRRPAVTRSDVDAGRADMEDYVAAMREAQIEDVEIDFAFKNADMLLFPHSWVSPPSGTLVMLDPVNTHDLLMLHEAGEDVADLIHKGYIKVGDKVNRKGPPGVTPVSWKWK